MATKRLSRGLTVSELHIFQESGFDDSLIFSTGRQEHIGKRYSHLFRFQSQYTVPRLRTNTGILGNKILQYVLADWGMTWYLQYQSAGLVGLPATVTANPISKWLGRGPGPAQQALDASGQPIPRGQWIDGL